MKSRSGSDELLRCSFCHKSQDAVAKLISSPSDYPRAYICDECVAVCNSILEDDRTETHAAAAPDHLPKPLLGGLLLGVTHPNYLFLSIHNRFVVGLLALLPLSRSALPLKALN